MTTRPCLAIAFAIALAAALAIIPPAWAHGDEPHDAPAPSPLAADVAPRAAAQTESFELVAVLTHTGTGPTLTPTLTLYLDRFDSNAPVAGATVELESGAFKAVARQTEPGVYTLPGQAFAQPGRYPLTISVQASEADGGADLLETTLSYTQALHAGQAPGLEHAASESAWPASLRRIAAGLVGAMALGLVARAYLKRRARHASTQDLTS